jgi:GTP pyrophosphokinase
MPKANMYQSLHTTVVRPNGEPAEIQIRTKEMHEICEYGVAAHWSYKETNQQNMGQTDLQKFSWLRQIMQWQSELKDPNEFLEAVKVDLFDEEIFVFTPKGDVINLPHKATALDFAFAVHTNVGIKTIGAKVNGRIAPIKKKLESGDIVEILTSPNQKPSKDWLNFVSTSKARNKIRSFLRAEQRDQSRKIGKEFLMEALEDRGLSYETLEKAGDLEKLVKAAKESQLEDLLVAIGYGKINAKDLITKVFPAPVAKETTLQNLVNKTAFKGKAPKRHGILVSDYEDVLVTIARCCLPIPGDPIVGFITRGKGVSVHRANCPRALDLDPARQISVAWSQTDGERSHRCHLRIRTHDKPGVLAEVTSAISGSGVNVHKAEAKVSRDLTGLLEFELGVKNIDQLDKVISHLENISSVVSVERRDMLKSRRLRKFGRHG